MRITLRIDYLDIDGAVVFSDPVTCAEDEAKPLRDIEDDDRVWDVVFFGLEDEENWTDGSAKAGRVLCPTRGWPAVRAPLAHHSTTATREGASARSAASC